MSNTSIVLAIVAVVAIAFAAYMFVQRERTRKLRARFGPEYDRQILREGGNASRAEAVLEGTQKRVKTYELRPLTSEESARFAGQWRLAQERFVDDPRGAVAAADSLVTEALRACGYPVGDFDRMAADVSVEHPHLVADYRFAHEIASRSEKGSASTEDLRKAMQGYRNLFEDILGSRITEATGRAREREEVHRI